ncbi:MAG TPA: hypothetical protein VF141_20615 [Chryseolinea sp.]
MKSQRQSYPGRDGKFYGVTGFGGSSDLGVILVYDNITVHSTLKTSCVAFGAMT